jgi:hypothetical protein
MRTLKRDHTAQILQNKPSKEGQAMLSRKRNSGMTHWKPCFESIADSGKSLFDDCYGIPEQPLETTLPRDITSLHTSHINPLRTPSYCAFESLPERPST